MAFDGNRLREAREQAGITQDQLAALVGASRRSPSRWENGEVDPSLKHVVRIADVTGKPIDFFIREHAA